MSCFFQQISKLVPLLALAWSVASHATAQVKCSISEIHLPAMTKSLPLGEPEYVGGHVDVLCTSAFRESLTVEFALLEAEEDVPKVASGGSSRIRVDLFSDRAMYKALPRMASQVTDFPTKIVVANTGEARVSVPFHAKVYLEALIAGGSYNIGREIGLVYRWTPTQP